jgi:hypothetical protein
MVTLGMEKSELAKLHPIQTSLFPPKPFGIRTITIFYTLLSCFYIQPYILTYKRNLLSK